ncbi:MAG: crossover junction endodeoxyribonuclease RuvC [Symbiobacteriia bacterium]
MRVLGVDPGTALCGYGVVDMEGNHLHVVTYGCVSTHKDTLAAERLLQVYEGITQVIEQFAPEVLAVEELFMGRNVTTAISVGQARGVVLLAGAQHGLELAEYTPGQVKQAVAGYGKAEKAQVQQMIKVLLGLSEIPKPDDVADALAVACCCLQSIEVERRLRRLTAGALAGAAKGRGRKP